MSVVKIQHFVGEEGEGGVTTGFLDIQVFLLL